MGWPHGRGEEEAAWDATPEGGAQQFVVTVVAWMHLLQLFRKSQLTLIDIVTSLENYLFINGS